MTLYSHLWRTLLSVLLSFQFSNYRSFRKVNTLHLTRERFKKNRPSDSDWEKVTYRATGLFGPNGTGKSSILEALLTLQDAAMNSARDHIVLQSLRAERHPGQDAEPTTFLVDYVAEGVRYRWEVELTHDGVTGESLHACVTGPWRLVFERTNSAVRFGPTANITSGTQDSINQPIDPWTLVMSAWREAPELGIYSPAITWWENSLLGLTRTPTRTGWVSQLVQDGVWLDLVREAAKAADLGIIDVSLDDQPLALEDPEKFTSLPGGLRFTYQSRGNTFNLSADQLSAGTRAWLDITVPALTAVLQGSVFVVDDIDRSLHPDLVRTILDLFTDPSINHDGAQVVFSSHDVTILGNHPEPALDRESTWFVAKEQDEFELYCLAEFKLRANHNVEKRYLQGTFGALPVPKKAGLRDLIYQLQEAKNRSQAQPPDLPF